MVERTRNQGNALFQIWQKFKSLTIPILGQNMKQQEFSDSAVRG